MTGRAAVAKGKPSDAAYDDTSVTLLTQKA